MKKTNKPLRMNLSFFSEGELPEEETAIDEKPQEETPKMFTQADLDRLVGKTKLELKAKIPDAEKMKAFKTWEESQQSETEKAIQKDKDFLAAQNELTKAKLEVKLLKSGIPEGLIKYAMLDIAEHEDVDAGITSFKDSDIFKNLTAEKPADVNFGGNGKVTDTGKVKGAEMSLADMMAEANNNPSKVQELLSKLKK